MELLAILFFSKEETQDWRDTTIWPMSHNTSGIELRLKSVLPGIMGWTDSRVCSAGQVTSEMLHPVLATSKKLLTGNNCDPEERSQRSKRKCGKEVTWDVEGGKLWWEEFFRWCQMTCFQDTDAVMGAAITLDRSPDRSSFPVLHWYLEFFTMKAKPSL